MSPDAAVWALGRCDARPDTRGAPWTLPGIRPDGLNLVESGETPGGHGCVRIHGFAAGFTRFHGKSANSGEGTGFPAAGGIGAGSLYRFQIRPPT